jgi:glutamyl-tRNA reductase
LPDGGGGLLVVGLSRTTAPLGLLERASLDRTAARRVLQALGTLDEVEEAIALSTCNRTELYVVTRAGPQAIMAAFVGHTKVSERELTLLGYVRAGEAAVEHFFAVIAGLDSTILGEPEIVAQVRAAVALAEEEGTLDRVLAGLWTHGLAASRRIRAGTSITRGAVSIAAIAVDLADTLVDDLSGRRALVIGAGKIARGVTQRLVARGVRPIIVANRSARGALTIARDAGGRAVGLDGLGPELACADLVVCATGAPSTVVPARMLAAATRERPDRLVVLDLAIPRDVEPSAADLPAVVLRDIDEIQRIAAANLDDRRRELPRAWSIVCADAERFGAWRARLDAEPVLTALRRRAEEIRLGELARARAQSPTADEAELERLDVVTRSLINKLLYEPTTRIRSAGASTTGRAQLQAVRELFDLGDTPAA